jgi:hypothetical protein
MIVVAGLGVKSVLAGSLAGRGPYMADKRREHPQVLRRERGEDSDEECWNDYQCGDE